VGGLKKKVKKVNTVVVLSIQEFLNWLKLSSEKKNKEKRKRKVEINQIGL
jgi:hypothetical protein